MKIGTALIAIAATVLGSGLAAEPANGQQAPVESEAARAEVSEEELGAFAEAYLEVQEIGAEHEQLLADVATPEEAQALQQRAQSAMVEAVNEAGLQPDRYGEIATALNEDEALRLRFYEVLEDSGVDLGRN